MPFSARAAARRRPAWAGLALLGTLSLAATAQTPPGPSAEPPPTLQPNLAPLDWRQANDQVGRFLRGHADLIKTEPPLPPAPVPAGPVLELAAAQQRALGQRADLFDQPGQGPAEQLRLRRERLALSAQVVRAWSQAMLADRLRASRQAQQDTAEAGAELARRMLQAGHWSQAQWLAEQGQALQARLDAEGARLAALDAREALARLLGEAAPPDWRWPAELPALAPIAGSEPALLEQALARHETTRLARLQARRAQAAVAPEALQRARDTLAQATAGAANAADPGAPLPWPGTALGWGHELAQALLAEQAAGRAEALRRSQLREALARWRHGQASVATLQALAEARDEGLADTQRRYNGMLHSTWDLLASARAQSAAHQALQQARHALWLSQQRVLHLLAGGEPLQGD